VAPAPALATSGAGEKLSPVVRRLLTENGLEAGDVTGTGPGGRVTKDDVLDAAAAKSAPTTSAGVAQLSPVVRRLLNELGLSANDVTGTGPDGRITRRDVELAASQAGGGAAVAPREGDEVIAFSKIRKLTAEHMVRSKATSAHTLMVKEVDFETVERVRRAHGATFKAAEGFSLTYLPFIAVATLVALREFPHLNSSVGDNELIVHHTLNLGIAVDLDSEGLVVPVVKRADALNVSEMARTIRDLATRARTKALGIDDMSGGTFTITNPGPYGTLITGAIINQPQVAILSTDGVTRKPVVVTGADGSEAITIHSVGLVALTFDHRAVDGAYAARFLARLAQLLQESDWASRL
jgi:2-oxoglutarate dehydrogenase E2 component (dihydrolipoamide succinyltransferase)